MRGDTRSKLLFWGVIATMVVLGLIMLLLTCGDTKGGLKMQDSKGNIIESGDKLKSDLSPAGQVDVIIVDISITNIATLERLRGPEKGKRFSISRESLKKSSGVKVEPSHIPAQRGKGD